jgi:DNA-binding NtrC family response regulator
MKEYFGMHGFEVDSACDVRSAQGLIENGGYAAAVLDLRLKREDDGFHLLRDLRRLHPTTGVVILSVDYSFETRERAKRCGAHAFLGKPKPLSQVAQVVHALVESRAATNRLLR